MKKLICIAFSFCLSFSCFGQTAYSLIGEAAKKDNLEQSVVFLEKSIPLLTLPSEKRSSYAFLGGLYENSGEYVKALNSYAKAASIGASDGENMPKKSSEQLVLDAVRCALSAGDWATAQNYLNSAVRNSTDPKVIAYVKLYEQWGILCKAKELKDTQETVAILKTYANLDSMKSVRPQILFTLWHITGEKEYSASLKKDYPLSPECAVIKGEIQTLPSPFWYFVPRNSNASTDIENSFTDFFAKDEKSVDEKDKKLKEKVEKTEEKDNSASTDKTEKIVRQQLGLFREEGNANSLVKKLNEKGFAAKITSETRPSGTKYYLVLVDENPEGTIAQELRTAGFECYPVFE
ncbi:SPOR domain-containing protein [Treponema pectinovorum]|uniref:SPOR domain-containing protein n=1 Tax=Treponema pectinovorum TaxID=164 RepID=UPI0011CC1063|nr:SPOR domain-containing protein [Treponema pectinovorum]